MEGMVYRSLISLPLPLSPKAPSPWLSFCPRWPIGKPFLLSISPLILPQTVGQMQGKFCVKLLPGTGHAIQEDAPVDTASELMAFQRRWTIVREKVLKLKPGGIH